MDKKKEPEISEKNKKSEILDAYYEALNKLKERKKVKPQEEKKKREEQEISDLASQLSCEGIIKGIADVKLKVGKAFDEIEEELTKYFAQFIDLQKAISIAKKNFDEMYHIQIETDSLDALIESQQKQKEEFESEIEQERKEFDEDERQKKREREEEQREYESEIEKHRAEYERVRKREEEEYLYQLKINRKKDADLYEDQKQALEKELLEKRQKVEQELAEREKNIAEKEQELEQLHAEAEAFPHKLQEAISSTRKQTADEVKQELKFQMEISQKEIEGEKKLFQLRIQALEGKIKEQQALIGQLSNKAHEAGQQVQDIAVRAIEGASRRVPYTTYAETATVKD